MGGTLLTIFISFISDDCSWSTAYTGGGTECDSVERVYFEVTQRYFQSSRVEKNIHNGIVSTVGFHIGEL